MFSCKRAESSILSMYRKYRSDKANIPAHFTQRLQKVACKSLFPLDVLLLQIGFDFTHKSPKSIRFQTPHQNPVKYLRRSLLREELTVFSREIFL